MSVAVELQHIQKEEAKENESKVLQYFKVLREKWQDMPDVTIEWEDLEYSIDIPVKDTQIPNLPRWLLHLFAPKQTKKLPALEKSSGIIRPGTSTLVLAPPGHGKSSLLKTLAGRYTPDSRPGMSGKVRYNGKSVEQSLKEDNLHVNRITAYVDQAECHMALLTVRETFQFALENSSPPPSLLPEEAAKWQEDKLDLILKMLGLEECQNTMVGNDMFRGISGGQKRRVTIGEMLLSNARALFLDEITTGLDAAMAYDLIQVLHQFAHLTNGSVVIALLQPSPEIFNTFDDIILLRNGHVVYHGPRDKVMDYFRDDLGVECPATMDAADFIVEFLTDPVVFHENFQKRLQKEKRKALKHQKEQKAHEQSSSASSSSLSLVPSVTPSAIVAEELPNHPHVVVFHANEEAKEAGDKKSEKEVKEVKETKTKRPVLSDKGLVTTWKQHKLYQQLQDTIKQYKNTLQQKPKPELSPYTRASYYQTYSHSLGTHFKSNLVRQAKYMARNPRLVGPRIGQAIFMGLVLGSLYYQIGDPDYASKMGMILFSITNGAFASMTEMPITIEAKNVVYKQLGAHFFQPLAYILAVTLVAIPLAFLESMIFSLFLYWMVGFVTEGGRFIFFWFLMFSTNMAMGAFNRGLTYFAPNEDAAHMLASPFVAIFLLNGGFLITRKHIPNFLIWLYYSTPFSYAVRSMALNEYLSNKYDYPVPASYGVGSIQRFGDFVLEQYEFQLEKGWIWGGIGFLYGWLIIFTILSAIVIAVRRFELTLGTRRLTTEEEAEEVREVKDMEHDEEIPAEPAGELGRQHSSFLSSSMLALSANAIPFEPQTLSFENIVYTVQVPAAEGSKKMVDRILLRNVSGFAKPRTMTALMGSSGAGKTTLMDAIAGRKTEGKLEGKIKLNGHEVDKTTFSRLCGYVEQRDLLHSMSTVRETLTFSAKLRLPASVSDKERAQFVEDTLKLLELDSIADRLIGDEITPSLSPGQLKRVTIGVELVANPSIIFLDEPTSGLDSRAALIVMRTVKRIALTGRSVVCTIHQPSAELFEMFDRLLLLKSGGYQVYFGDLGDSSSVLIDYMTGVQHQHINRLREAAQHEDDVKEHVHEFVAGNNPATWMLEVIGAGTSNHTSLDFVAAYEQSELKKQAEADQQVAGYKLTDQPKKFEHEFAASYWTQSVAVTDRLFRDYWRNVNLNGTRILVFITLGLIFGLVYLQLGDDNFAGVASKISVIFMTGAFCGAIQSSSALPVLSRFRSVFYREKASNTYSPHAYTVGLTLVELPYIFFLSLLFVIPLYYLVGFIDDGEIFFKYLLPHFLLSMFFCYFGQWLAAFAPDIAVAYALQGLLFTFLFLFGGIFILPKAMPIGWKWVYWINPVPKAVVAMSVPQFAGRDDGVKIQGVPRSQFVNEFLNTNGDEYGAMIGWMILIIAVIRLLGLLSFRYISHIRR